MATELHHALVAPGRTAAWTIVLPSNLLRMAPVAARRWRNSGRA